MHIHISTSAKDLQAISSVMESTFSYVELKRMDESAEKMALSFVVEAKDLQEIDLAKKRLMDIDPGASISFVEQRNIAAW